MPSLSEAYDGGEWSGRDPRRVSAGGSLFALGALAVGSAILVLASADVAGLFGASGETATRRLAGTLAGLGVPALFVGVVAVLPSSRRERLGVLCGALATVAGVWLFRQTYPDRWVGASDSLAFPTAMVYFVGGCVALWFVLSAVATFKLRNNPQGTVTLAVTRRGETTELRVSRGEYRRYEQAIRGEGDADGVAAELRERLEE